MLVIYTIRELRKEIRGERRAKAEETTLDKELIEAKMSYIENYDEFCKEWKAKKEIDEEAQESIEKKADEKVIERAEPAANDIIEAVFEEEDERVTLAEKIAARSKSKTNEEMRGKKYTNQVFINGKPATKPIAFLEEDAFIV